MPEVPKIVRERLRGDAQAGGVAFHPDVDLLNAFAEQVLLSAERERVLAHLALCEECRAVVITALPAVEAAVAAEPDAARISQPVLRTSQGRWFSGPLLGWRNLSWGALAAGIAVAGAVLLHHPGDSTRSVALKQAAPTTNSQPAGTAAQKAAPAATPGPSSISEERALRDRATRQIATNLGSRASAQKKALLKAKEGEVPSTVVAENKMLASPHPGAKDNSTAMDRVIPAAPAAAPSSSRTVEAMGAGAGQVQTEDARLSASIVPETAQNLPVNGRNVTSLQITRAKPPTAAEQGAPTQMAKAGPRSADVIKRLDKSQPPEFAGSVTDPRGAGVANAKVTITNQRTGRSMSTTTDQSGAYALNELLPVGTYKLTAEASGFKTVSDANVPLNAGVTARVDFKMPVGQAAEVVEVTGALQAVQTEDTKLYKTVGAAKWALSAGVLRRSLDDGKSWQSVLTDNQLLCSAALGSDVWAGGKAGALHHSSDNGATWVQMHPAIGNRSLASDVTGIQVHSATEIALSTRDGETWTTPDGGKSWTTK